MRETVIGRLSFSLRDDELTLKIHVNDSVPHDLVDLVEIDQKCDVEEYRHSEPP